ncbi:hypothetical protein HJ01_01718 [Flavobacterium frigoris PS1]|uniref:Uncharacterized protein n=1 Tax=Flavobacterium frigoris (strain PS1) TaxID=1086011 RepID=H7FRG9_FLAFP|nr:hypothetical protein HJ01_01718 [Flavobacterium frigoris PS1]
MGVKEKNRTIPVSPQTAVPINKIKIVIKALIFKLPYTVRGVRKLSETN